MSRKLEPDAVGSILAELQKDANGLESLVRDILDDAIAEIQRTVKVIETTTHEIKVDTTHLVTNMTTLMSQSSKSIAATHQFRDDLVQLNARLEHDATEKELRAKIKAAHQRQMPLWQQKLEEPEKGKHSIKLVLKEVLT
ncbi:hypothetical protein B0H67DRAFT_650404 [Lasiosphaeris hirsuta]|uniref:Uncharacterized protein n=1 Tax=Lasiosphaeris hirsuta TaxID=260670 RepID=A0AA39ZRL4_9PEZI|nr:hypothetical protein B0H67DRAFT_650404 [Lasiosphaeris hirsuta]